MSYYAFYLQHCFYGAQAVLLAAIIKIITLVLK